MKSFTTVATVALATAAAARSGSLLQRQADTCIVDTVTSFDLNENSDQVSDSINQWNSDVLAVNDFLNNAHGLDAATLGAHAQAALINAQDEPCQLATLNSFGTQFGADTDAFNCAVSDLEAVFVDHVITNLNTIIADPSNTDAVDAAIQDINFFRCCNVLPDADLLWLDVAADEGLVGTVPITAARPDACASIDCSGVTSCKTKDNGSFGK